MDNSSMVLSKDHWVKIQKVGNACKNVLHTIEEHPVASAIVSFTILGLANSLMDHKYTISCNKGTGFYCGPSLKAETIQ